MYKARFEECHRCEFFSEQNGTCDRYLRLGKGFRLGKQEGSCDKFLRKGATEEEYEQNRMLNGLTKTTEYQYKFKDFSFGKGNEDDVRF